MEPRTIEQVLESIEKCWPLDTGSVEPAKTWVMDTGDILLSYCEIPSEPKLVRLHYLGVSGEATISFDSRGNRSCGVAVTREPPGSKFTSSFIPIDVPLLSPRKTMEFVKQQICNPAYERQQS